MNALPMASRPKVHVIDDDAGLRHGLQNLLHSAGVEVATFASPIAFSSAIQPGDRGCLLLDIHFPDLNGLDLQTQLNDDQVPMPVIIMTGRPDVASSIRGLKSGASDFLIKPIEGSQLLAAIEAALEHEQRLWTTYVQRRDAEVRYASLTVREKEVFALVTMGLMNKQVAGRLNLSPVTVKIHRGTMMRKMGARTLADLVRMSEILKHSMDENPRLAS